MHAQPTDDATANRAIYETRYSKLNTEPQPQNAYDEKMVRLRLELVERYGAGKDVLDLCCGTGAYLRPLLPKFQRVYALDFSHGMVRDLRSLAASDAPAIGTMRGDATQIPLPDSCVDLVYSYSALYTIPNVHGVISEIGRVLRPGGHAILDLGNRWSLNTLVVNANHRERGTVKPQHISYAQMLRAISDASCSVVERHSFQLLPMYGAPKRLLPLLPLLHPAWKKPMSLNVGGKMLDERLSGAWPLRHLAFRHVLVVRREP